MIPMMKLKMFALCVALSSAQVYSATEWHVYSDTRDGLSGTQQLTNAFKRAQRGDTITIHKGTYNVPTEEMTFRYETDAAGTLHATDGTCLDSSVTDLIVRGDPEASRDEIILSGLGANDATKDGQHAIMRLSGKNCKVRHLTFYRGLANSNYFVYRNGQQMNTDKWIFRRGGGLNLGDATSVCEDCVFDKCYAGQGACIYGGGEARNCIFKNSNAAASNAGCAVCDVKAVYDSLFDSNARGALRGCSVVASNCVFAANWHNGSNGLLYYHTGGLVDCVFSNNTTVCAYLHGAKYMPKEITRCVFWNNSDSTYSAGIGGSVPCTVPVKKCTFVGNLQVSDVTAKISDCVFASGTARGVIADCSDVEDCRFEGGGKTLTGSSGAEIAAFDRCSFKRCSFVGTSLHWAYGFRDCHRVEDCLITESVQWGTGALFCHSDAADATYENCTIVTNGALNTMFANTAGAGTITFKNTLFHNNEVSGQSWGKFDFYSSNNTGFETLYMDHTVYRAGNNDAEAMVAGTGIENMLWKSFNPMFKGADDPVHPYAIKRRSPCVAAGQVETWMETATDLAGNLRLRDGKVDIGCYQNWDPVPGMLLILR